ncbi:E-selectin-like [Branchiostoma floridae x Branchiostoma belcheri]
MTAVFRKNKVGKSCRELNAPENGDMSGGHHYGDVVTFRCDPGFVPVGSSARTCQADQRWSGTDFSCHPVECARPTAPENGAMTPLGSQQDPGFFYRDMAEFSCNKGYDLTGQASISCRADGSWSSGVPTCTAVPCPQPTVPVNGEMTSGSDPDHDMVNFAFQDTVSFTCDLGYDLVGAESVTCQADSTWSDSFPTCTPVQCPMPETPVNGAMTGLNFYQDVLEFTCDSGYDLIGETRATCHADRTWSARAPTCTDINECVVSPWICGRNSACVNLDGSFDCKCLSGYEMGPGGCQDIDECSSKLTCAEDTFCVNDPGTYHCVCREGFTGDGVTCTG